MKYALAFFTLLTVHTSATATDPFSELNCEAFVKMISTAKLHPSIESKSMFDHEGTTWYIDTKDLEKLILHTADRHAERPSAIKFDSVEEADDRVRYYYNATIISPYEIWTPDIGVKADKNYKFKLTCFPQMKKA